MLIKKNAKHFNIKHFIEPKEVEFIDINQINLHPHYYAPEEKDMAIVIPFFNPTNSVRLVQNFLFIDNLLQRANIPVIIIELAYNNLFITKEIDDNDRHIIHVRSDSVMFHKENLLNIGINKVIYSKYCILDADIIFSDLNWYNNLSNLLSKYDVIQPYQKAYWMALDMKTTIRSKFSVGFNLKARKGKLDHPGFVWGFKREWFEKIGNLPEFFISGGSDSILAHICFGSQINNYIDSELFNSYLDNCKEIEFSSNYMNGVIFHLFHGNIENRQYSERHKKITRAINRKIYLTKNSDGVLEWEQDIRTQMNETFMEYLISRGDDSV